MKNQRIAIVGAGTAGLAAATFLKRDGHEVTIFEKFPKPRPMGAGLLLQPTGLAILSLLGVKENIAAGGSRINKLYGKAVGKKRSTIDVKYSDYQPHLYGVGVHRGALFSALYQAAKDAKVALQTSCDIITITGHHLYDTEARQYGPFDLIIDASGSKSRLRDTYAAVKRNKPYPYGALWSTVPSQM